MKQNRALIVIDVQNEYFPGGALPVTYPENNIDNILMAIDIANEQEFPVILVQHIDTSSTGINFKQNTQTSKIYSEVDKRNHSYVIEKHLPDSFHETHLQALLKESNIDTVVICGYMTQMCCDTTARRAFHLGYNVEFLSDATGTLGFSTPVGDITAEELHKATLITQSIKFSKVISTKDWIKSLIN